MSEPTDTSGHFDPNATQPGRRATDLPPDAPWYWKWLDANIKEAWKWASMWWPAFCAALAETYAANPKEITDFVRGIVPDSWWPHMITGAFIASMVFRALKFTKPKEPS